jgi:adenosylcobyric acid synthase
LAENTWRLKTVMSQFKHGGHIRRLAAIAGLKDEELLDFSANLNPLGPPEWMRAVVSRALSSVVHYPDPECLDLKNAVSQRFGVPREEVLVGNGSTELIYLIPKAVDAGRAVMPVPSYADYAAASELAGLARDCIYLREDNDFAVDYDELDSHLEGNELVFLGHPNNPTGLALDRDSLLKVVKKNPTAVFVVDEAFLDLSHGAASFVDDRPENVIVLVSLTKTYAIPGLRLGCALADHDLVTRVEEIQPPWSVNRLALAVGIAALDDTSYLAQTRELVGEEGVYLDKELQSIPGLKVYPGVANYRLIKIGRKDLKADNIARRLLSDGIAIRECENFDGLDDSFFRVAVRTRDENNRLLDGLRSALGIAAKPKSKRPKPAIMFQGTSSNAGKSVLTAALCRILFEEGYCVAPFKAQNMSLNSFVTRTGGEMGRAQVVQAQACRLEPDVRMNPVLLKPSSDTGSQVIVMGEPIGNMDVDTYVEYKSKAFQASREAFDSLSQDYDVLVLEGAGSPGEVNLKSHDIVNMKMAQYASAPVLLVGDIDRGGVFASFVGTMEVLAEWERRMVAGFVVNRFRGQEDLLRSAFDYTEHHTGKPVLGTVPFIQPLGLPEEDSVTFKSGFFDDTSPSEESVEIAVIDLPHISNFTDFDAFRVEPDVRLRVIRSTDDLNEPDAIILPGSKNVIGDLEHLRQSGLDRRIHELASAGRTELVGVCGGFQMIGRLIADPHHIESEAASIEGLGFLGLTTVMAPQKTLMRTTAVHVESGEEVQGYEIHHGVTDSGEAEAIFRRDDGELIGAGSPDGKCWGAYIHGVFDSDSFRRWFVDRLRVRRGLPAMGRVRGSYDLEPAFDRLADVVRQSLRIEEVFRLMGL